MAGGCAAHERCCEVSTSHDGGTDSCARWYGTGAQPDGVPNLSESGPAAACRALLIFAPGGLGLACGGASAQPAVPSMATATTAATAPVVAAGLPCRARGVPCPLSVIPLASPRSPSAVEVACNCWPSDATYARPL
jgi:hypothetical protein